MNVEARDSAFPPSVQPGIPRLGRLPGGWIKAPLSRFLREVRRPLKMGDDTEYRLVTVKRSRGGVVERSVTAGRDISVKSQFYVRPRDFLISKRQIVHGACGLVPESLDGSIVSNEYSVLNGNGEIDLRFLSYLSHSRFFQQTCFHSSIGVHVEKMIFKLDRWLSWEFHLPPLPEQQKIAEILSTWDKAIETTEALLANARTQKRALMQSLLTGTRRFPGFEDRPWREVRLADLVDLISGNAFESVSFGKDGVKLVRGSNVKRGELDWSDGITRRWPTVEGFERYLLKKGDIVLAMDGAQVGRSYAIIEEQPEEPMLLVQRVARLRSRDGVDPYFIYGLIDDLRFQKHVEAVKTVTAIPHISMNDLRDFPLHCPYSEEQRKIGELFQAAMGTCSKLAEDLDRLVGEKNSLMQNLLTGKRRVVV